MIRWFWGVLIGCCLLVILSLYVADRYGPAWGLVVGVAIGGVLLVLLGGLFARSLSKDAAQTQVDLVVAQADAEKMRAAALVEALRFSREQLRGVNAFDKEARSYAGLLVEAQRSQDAAAASVGWGAAPDSYAVPAAGGGGGPGGFVWVE